MTQQQWQNLIAQEIANWLQHNRHSQLSQVQFRICHPNFKPVNVVVALASR